jgi:hypothetical protein
MDRNIKFRIVFVVFLALFMVNFAIAEDSDPLVYSIFLDYSFGNFSLNELNVVSGISPLNEYNEILEHYYLLKLFSFDRELLYESNFSFSTDFAFSSLPEWFDQEGNQIYIPPENDILEIEFGVEMVSLVIPYFSNGKIVEIFNFTGEKVFEIDVGYLAKVCGNGVCNDHESYADCLEDCKSGSKDDYCDGIKDFICDVDCVHGIDPDCGIFSDVEIKYDIAIQEDKGDIGPLDEWLNKFGKKDIGEVKEEKDFSFKSKGDKISKIIFYVIIILVALIVLVVIREIYKIFRNKLILYKQNKKSSLIKKALSGIFSRQGIPLQKKPLFRTQNKKFLPRRFGNFRKS